MGGAPLEQTPRGFEQLAARGLLRSACTIVMQGGKRGVIDLGDRCREGIVVTGLPQVLPSHFAAIEGHANSFCGASQTRIQRFRPFWGFKVQVAVGNRLGERFRNLLRLNAGSAEKAPCRTSL